MLKRNRRKELLKKQKDFVDVTRIRSSCEKNISQRSGEYLESVSGYFDRFPPTGEADKGSYVTTLTGLPVVHCRSALKLSKCTTRNT